MKRQFWLLLALMSGVAVASQAQVAQPYITTASPMGAKRGTTMTFTIDGYNLTNASEIIWSKPGITSRITLNSELVREPHTRSSPAALLIVDKSTKHRLTIEAVISPEALPGIYSFRIRTPLGTTNMGRIAVGSLPEIKDREMNDSAEDAQSISLPVTITGDLQKRGDADYFKFSAKAGQQIVFEVMASMLNSRLDSVLTLFDEKGAQLATNNDNGASRDSLLGYAFKQDGEYVIRITDLERQGQMSAYGYRLNIGELTYITHVFPLGVRENMATNVANYGFNLDAQKSRVRPQQRTGFDEGKLLMMSSARGDSYNALRLAIGAHPEVTEQDKPTTLAAPQTITWPVTINGRIFNLNAATDEDFYRFKATKGQRIVLEVGAQRYGSPLDSVIEVFDGKGNQIPRVIARALLETQMTLNDRDSATRGFRITTWNGIHVNDYLMAGNELVQVEVLPKTPDEDIFFKNFQGARLTYEGTTPEAHANGSTVYKASLHPPGTQLSQNGLPVTTFYFRNDDGGPMYGKDSKLNFIAPEDGEYIVRIRDVRGMQGERFAYRLTIHEPEPDFALFADQENPNVPQGATLPITVTAYRNDGFNGDIAVRLPDLPAGFTASEGVIRAGQSSTVVTLSASKDVRTSFPLHIQASATINGKPIIRELKMDERIAVVSVAPPPELQVWTDAEQVALEPGGKVSVSIKIKRDHGFAGRVPFDIRNLPHGVIVTDVGLNGVMITEEETTQRFTLSAESWVEPMAQPIFVVGRIETTSPQRSEFAAKPFILIIKPKENGEGTVKSGQR
ncbi:MAG: PPC domain-containing protein [Blastocatellia bacterium]